VVEAIHREKRENSLELTDIHTKLVDQRELFEQDLAARLEVADKFVADFSDLHMDVGTQRIADECRELRETMTTDNDRTLKLLTDNDALQIQLKKLQEKNQIFKNAFERARKLDALLADRADAVEAQMRQQGVEFSEAIKMVEDDREYRVRELRLRAQELRDANVRLKQETALAARDLAAAEGARFERLRTDCELLQLIRDAAAFILAGLDRRYGEDDRVARRRTQLTQVVRRLATIRVVHGVIREVRDTTDVAVQTDGPRKVLAPPKAVRVTLNPRVRGIQQRFQDAPDYRRVYRQPCLRRDMVKIRFL
jgi:hypothetical protein